jgi:hypothetical protein
MYSNGDTTKKRQSNAHKLGRDCTAGNYAVHKKKASEGCSCGSCKNTVKFNTGLIRCLVKNKFVLQYSLCERHIK